MQYKIRPSLDLIAKLRKEADEASRQAALRKSKHKQKPNHSVTTEHQPAPTPLMFRGPDWTSNFNPGDCRLDSSFDNDSGRRSSRRPSLANKKDG